jgi:hypothetical protein
MKLSCLVGLHKFAFIPFRGFEKIHEIWVDGMQWTCVHCGIEGTKSRWGRFTYWRDHSRFWEKQPKKIIHRRVDGAVGRIIYP